MATVVLGVTGGIAAYKAVELLRILKDSGNDVTVVPTQSALRFVGEPTWAALSGQPVATEVWSSPDKVTHVALGQRADLVLIAPATADFLARAVRGIASDLLTNVVLTARCPVVIAPAMHTEMWQHPATEANVSTLRERGVLVLEPAVGRLTGADSGPGRFPEPELVADVARDVLRRRSLGHSATQDLRGSSIVVSAGGTHEAWDDVRFLGNRSSGKQGFALARAAIARGAEVTVVVGSVTAPIPAGCSIVRVESAEQMRESMHACIAEKTPDVVVMAAAVADFRPERHLKGKITKEDLAVADHHVPELALQRTTDILAELVAKRGSQSEPIIVGFAAETPHPGESLASRALKKLQRKGCDYLVANAVNDGAVFGEERTSVVIVARDGRSVEHRDVEKLDGAHALWDMILPGLGLQHSSSSSG
jgi:phosphopantothenoylcysteine decarboxylase/phosphopantothenate--cysteine ligase